MIIVVTSWNFISGDTNCGKWLISCNFKFQEKDKILMNQASGGNGDEFISFINHSYIYYGNPKLTTVFM